MNYILDTNIWLAAAGKADCLKSCLECQNFIANIVETGGQIVVDAASFIGENPPGNSVWQELKQNFTVQDYYYALFWEHFYNNWKIETVELEYEDGFGAKLPNGIEIFQEEQDGTRHPFEPNDRKWVALHLLHKEHPPIHNATDSDWHKARNDLRKYGIMVNEICGKRIHD